MNQFVIAQAAFVGDARQMGVALFAVLANDLAVVVLVLSEEVLRVVVAVNVDLRNGIVSRWIDTTLARLPLQPRQKQL